VIWIFVLFLFAGLWFRILGIKFRIEFRVIGGHGFGQVFFILLVLLAESGFNLLDRVLGEGNSLYEGKSSDLGYQGVETARASRGVKSFDRQKIRAVSLYTSCDNFQGFIQFGLGPPSFKNLHPPVFELIAPEYRQAQISGAGINGEDRTSI
jgi:hypothetical protein